MIRGGATVAPSAWKGIIAGDDDKVRRVRVLEKKFCSYKGKIVTLPPTRQPRLLRVQADVAAFCWWIVL